MTIALVTSGNCGLIFLCIVLLCILIVLVIQTDYKNPSHCVRSYTAAAVVISALVFNNNRHFEKKKILRTSTVDV